MGGRGSGGSRGGGGITSKAVQSDIRSKNYEKEINSTRREILFLETALTRTQEKILPEMNKELESMIKNKAPKKKINQQRKLINKCIAQYNKSIDSYNEHKKYLKTLEASASKFDKKLKHR